MGCQEKATCVLLLFLTCWVVMAENKEIVTAASDDLSDLGEGPFWDSKSQTLLYVDAFVGDICRLDPETRKTEKVHFDTLVTFVIPTGSNARQMVISVGNEIRMLHWDARTTRLLAVPEKDIKGNRFNDAKCDVTGRLWAGTLSDLGDKEAGALWSLDPKTLESKRHVGGIAVSNGIAWTLDNRRMFFVDSGARRIYAFDYDPNTGTPSNQSVLLDYNNHPELSDAGVPDGITMDSEEKLWVACYGGGRVIRVDPKDGSVLRTVTIPAVRTTSVAWGGPNYEDLYVTTAKRDSSAEQAAEQPLAGAVFKVEGLGVKGLPAFTFAA